MERIVKPDSDYKYRIISGYDGRRMTWHNLECKTGKNAKHSIRTAYTPLERRETIKNKRGYDPYYDDHMAHCCLNPTNTKGSNPTFTTREAQRIFAHAHRAGIEAGNAVDPMPMVVGTPTTFLGNDIDYSKKTYYVPEGMCGFAWVVIRPANSSIARHAAKLGIGSSAYGGGMEISVHDHGQSYERKQKHASAYAAVLREYGIEASPHSRLD